ncbi:MAG: 1-deoxy-D-xylulose-5-phosphate reductoisomerase [Chloroflexia bacterium]
MDTPLKRIAILGSTGSIGRQTLEVVEANPSRFVVYALAAGRDAAGLLDQVLRLRPTLACLANPDVPAGGLPVPLLRGQEGLIALATHPEVDLVVVATPGAAGLEPTLAAIRAGKEVALANKEVLVMAGEIVTAEAARHGVTLRPIDSEHSAIWQCLQGEERRAVARIILTASGGPFRAWPKEALARVTPQEALRHPTWRMGPKVTVDSATLFNKGMEIIEAHWLFGLPYGRIEVVVHPQSVIHSLVEFCDGSVKAQLGFPDMRLPIQYALGYPERLPTRYTALDWKTAGPLTFEAVDTERFPCLQLAREAGEQGGTYPAVLAAADEVAVELFLQGRIAFPDIPRWIEEALAAHEPAPSPLDLEAVRGADSWARAFVRSRVGG